MKSVSVDPNIVREALLELEREERELNGRQDYCDMCLKPCRVGPGNLCKSCHKLEYYP